MVCAFLSSQGFDLSGSEAPSTIRATAIPECVPDFVEAHGRVLHGVVEDARHDHVLGAAGVDEDLRHGERVDDVGDLRPLPAVPAVGAGGEFDGIEDGSHVSAPVNAVFLSRQPVFVYIKGQSGSR